jgi:hypothetical protein
MEGRDLSTSGNVVFPNETLVNRMACHVVDAKPDTQANTARRQLRVMPSHTRRLLVFGSVSYAETSSFTCDSPILRLPVIERGIARVYPSAEILRRNFGCLAIPPSSIGRKAHLGPYKLRRSSFGGRLPTAISYFVAPSSPPEFLHGPVNDERGLCIWLFRFLFDCFSHCESL